MDVVYRCAWVLVGTLVLSLVSAVACAAVGRTAGEASVSDAGAAVYSIPLWTPPGINGIQPSLALTYSSRNGNGYFGVGWSLDGLSVIARCPKTWAQDGVAQEVRNDASDRFCLDGQQLKLVSGAYGGSGAEYRTEIESFSRVRSYGAAGVGPQSFVVERKSGLVLEYGATEDSRMEWPGQSVPHTWALNKVSDRAGNAMLLSYAEDALSSIQYTKNNNAGIAPHYEVSFVYEGGTSGRKRVDRVDVKHDGALVRRYELTYGSGKTLTSIQECAGETDCFAPTQFTYQSGTPGLSAEINAGFVLPSMSRPWALDVNGDGRSDLVYPSSPESGKGTWIVAFADSSGSYGAPINTGISNANWLNATAIDYNADGLEDLLVPYAGGTWWVLRGSASGFGAPIDTSASAVSTRARASDIDGDGLQDLVWAELNGYAGGDAIRYRLRVSGGAFSSNVETIVGPLPPEEMLSNVFGSNSRVPDFNGDGRGDITYQRIVRSRIDGTGGAANVMRGIVVYCPGGPSFGTSVDASSALTSFGDFNGDGRDDLIYVKGAATVVRFAVAGGFSSEVVLPASGQPAVLDWDGDGYDDVLTRNVATSEWSVIRSTGDGFAAPVSAGLSTNSEVVVADVNGDGLRDVAYGVSGTWTVRLRAGLAPDLLASATDGFGVTAHFAYEWLAKRQVVRTLTASTGVASPSTYVRTYAYSGAHSDGFDSRRVTDSRNGLASQQFFRRDRPYTGMTSQIDEIQPDGVTLIRRTQNLLSAKTFGDGAETRYFPFVEASVIDTYEVGGARNAEWVSHESVRVEIDDFGTPTRIVSATQDKDALSPGVGQVYLKTLTRQISNDVSSWCLGRSTQTTVESTAPDGGNGVRTQSASIDSAACRIVEQVIEPASDTLRVTTRYGFDVCGNTNVIQTIGRNPDGSEMPARTTSMNYGTRCQFPVSETNALSETSAQSWDYALGLLTASVDPGGIGLSWQYDGFGRLAREDRADRTYSIWTPSLNGVRRDDYGTDGQVFKWQLMSLDAFDRPLSVSYENAFGAVVEQRVTYDEFGRLASSSAPFFSSGGVPHFTTFQYDLANRLTRASRETSESDSTPLSTTISYEGLTTYVTDAQGRRATRTATVMGQIASSFDPNGYGQTFAYDPFGDLVRVQDSLGRTLQSNTYNLRGMRTASSDIDLGSWTFTNNSLGEGVSLTDANASTTTFTYDALSRPLTRVEADGSSAIRYSYKWNASGRLDRAQVAGGTVRDNRQSFKYDSAGRLIQVKYSDLEGSAEYWIDQTFSPTTGLLDTLIYPRSTSGYRLKLRYDYRNGELFRVSDVDTTFWLANASDARGNPIDETLGNGVRSTRKYDAVTGLLESIQSTTASGASVQSLAYHYDVVGNVTERQDQRQGLSERFFYDALDRLDYSTLDGAINLDLVYDESGNIASKSGVGAYGYDASKIHALTTIDGESAFAYDANGNALGDPRTFTLSHYPSNLLKSANWVDGGYSSAFFYGPDDRRFMQLAEFPKGSETITYIGGLLEKSASWKHYIFTPSGRTALYERRSDGANQTYYFTQDHLGSIDSITDASGGIRARLSYDAHGARRSELGWSGAVPDEDWRSIYAITHRGFTDHEMLDDLGVIHMNGRLYDPYSGRFISADPLVQSPLSTQSFNRYSYVRNNPLSATDPTGFAERNSHTQNGPLDVIGSVLVTGGSLDGWSGTVAYAYGTRSSTLDYGPSFTGGHGSIRSGTSKPRPRVAHVEIDCSPGLLICDDSGPLKPWNGPQEEPLDGLWDDLFFLAESAPRVAAVVGVKVLANRIIGRAVADSTGGITNAVPRTLARVTSGDTVRSTLGPPGMSDVFVTAADDIVGLNAAQLAQRLTIPASSRYTVVEFATPAEGLASPVFRTNTGFIGGGLTGGGAREFVVPNGPIPPGASIRIVGP